MPEARRPVRAVAAAAAPVRQPKSTNSIIGVETHHVIAVEKKIASAAIAAAFARRRSG